MTDLYTKIGGSLGLLFIYLTLVSVATFIVYGVDKNRAKHRRWRIPERTLLGMAFIGGASGAFVAMMVFHHKTKHLKFTLGVPAMILLQSMLIYVLLTTNTI